jgi:hypothetical protein
LFLIFLRRRIPKISFRFKRFLIATFPGCTINVPSAFIPPFDADWIPNTIDSTRPIRRLRNNVVAIIKANFKVNPTTVSDYWARGLTDVSLRNEKLFFINQLTNNR